MQLSFKVCNKSQLMQMFDTDKMSSEQVKDTAQAVLSGSISGVGQILISYPIKFIKTQMQLENKFGKERKYLGIFDCARQTIRNNGILGLYRGLNVFFYAARSGVSFGTYEMLKSTLKDSNGVLIGTNKFLCGLIAGGVEAALVNTPLETVECKLIHDRRLSQEKFKGFINGARIIIKEEGIRSLYAGLLPSVLKNAGNQGIRFYIVETLKNSYQKNDPTICVPKIYVGFFGSFAGFCSVFVTNPIDVVKTRLQSLHSTKYEGMIDCFFKLWRDEGFYTFYRGMSPRLFRTGLEASFTFMLYDISKDMLKSYS